MKKILFLFIFIINLSAFAEFPDFFSKWNGLLKHHTYTGQKNGINVTFVKYKTIESDIRYHKLLDDIEEFDPNTLETKEEKLACWINLYNIAAVKMIIDNYPINSIRNLTTLFKTVWKRKVLKINGRFYTLKEIEDDILRTMDEERIHFAINCASLSCPDLRKESYTPNNIYFQLEHQKELFLADTTKGMKKDGNTIYISKIFQWFAEDFDNGDLNKYLNIPKEKKIRFIKYKWDLNEESVN